MNKSFTTGQSRVGYSATSLVQSDWELWLTDVIRWLGVGLVFILPLIFGPGGSVPIAKMITLHIFVELLSLAVWLRFLEVRGWTKPRWWRLSPIELAILLLIVASGLSTWFGIDPRVSFWGLHDQGLGWLTQLHIGLGSIIIARNTRLSDDWLRLLIAVSAGSLIVSIQALFQYWTIDLPVFQTENLFNLGNGHRRSYATFGNPTHLTIYLSLIVPILLASWYLIKNQITRIAIITITGLALAATFSSITGHAGLQNGLYIVYGLFFLGSLAWFRLILINHRRLLIVLQSISWLIFSLLIVMNIVIIQPGRPSQNSALITNLLSRSASFEARLPKWEMARQAIRQRPWLGAGPETYQFLYPQYYSLSATGFDPIESQSQRAYNFGLDWLVTNGWIGLLALLLVLIIGFFQAQRVIANRHFEVWRRLFAAAISLSVIVYLGHLTLNFSAHADLLLIFLFLTLASQLAREKDTTQNNALTSHTVHQIKIIKFRGHGWPLGLGAVVLVLVIVWFGGLRFWLAELSLVKGNRIINQTEQSNPAIQQGLNELTHAVHYASELDATHIYLADALRRHGQYPEALALLLPIVNRHPGEFHSMLVTIETYLDQAVSDPKKWPDADAFLTDMMTKTKFWSPLFRGRIRLAVIEHDLAQANSIRDQARAWAPKSFIDWDQTIGIALVDYNQPATAIPILAASLKQHPTLDGWTALGTAYLATQDYPLADDAFLACTNLKPQNLNCWGGRWNSALISKDYPKMTEILEHIRAIDPQLGKRLEPALNNDPGLPNQY